MNVIMATENYVRTRQSALNRPTTDPFVVQVVTLGVAMMEECSGPHFTFVDPRRTRKDQIIIQAIRMSKRFEQALSDSRRRVIFAVSGNSIALICLCH